MYGGEIKCGGVVCGVLRFHATDSSSRPVGFMAPQKYFNVSRKDNPANELIFLIPTTRYTYYIFISVFTYINAIYDLPIFNYVQ